MKIQKGQKLTEEQKAQRAESRRRNTENTERRLRDHEEQKIIQAAKDKAIRKHLEAIRAKFVIEVTGKERQALFEISRRIIAKQHPAIPAAAYWALRFALCHPEKLLNWIEGIVHYEQAEGLNIFDLVGGKIEMAANHLQEQWVD
jgi:hypothetical protein